MKKNNQNKNSAATSPVTRRRFLAMASTTVAASAAKMANAHSCTSIPRIDIQSHLYVPKLVDLMKTRKELPTAYEKDGQTYVITGKWHRRLRKGHTKPEAKLAAMDAAGIETTVLSINDPGPERFDSDSVKAAQIANDFLDDIARAYPGRFAPLAFLPFNNMPAAQKELERCVEKLSAKGIYLPSNLNGDFPDMPQYRDLFKWAQQLDIPIVLHPAYPVTYEQTKDYKLTAGLGLMFDTTISLTRIILAGILEQYPNLKLVCPHVGGTLPYLIGRIDHQTQILKRGAENIKKSPSEYLKQVYFDTVSPIHLAVKYCYDLVGPDHLLYGSDHPWVQPDLISGHIKKLNLPIEEQKKIFYQNAKKLFKL